MANTQFNSSDKDKRVNISNSGMSINTTAADTYAFTIDYQTSGKYYFEAACYGSTGSGCAGIADPGGGGTNSLGFEGIHSFVVRMGGGIWANNVNPATVTPTFGRFCIAVDLDNKQGWIRANNGNWNNNSSANPATNTGGISLAYMDIASGVRPWAGFSPSTATATDNWTLNCGDSAFAQSVPSGFTGGWPLQSSPDGHDQWSNVNITTLTLDSTFHSANTTTFATGAIVRLHRGTTGRYYVEFYANNVNKAVAGNVKLGFATGGIAWTANTGADAFVDAVRSNDGQIEHGGSGYGDTTNVGGPWGTGNTICAAIDFDNKFIYFRRENGLWNNNVHADPSSNSNGVYMDGGTQDRGNAPRFPFFAASSAGNEIRINTGYEPFKYTMPTGFTGWVIDPVVAIGTKMFLVDWSF